MDIESVLSEKGSDFSVKTTVHIHRLFEKAKVYLTTPVRKAGYIDKTQVTENMVFAGETAFSAAQCDTRIKAVAINQNTGKTDVF